MICPECKRETGEDETEKLLGVEYCCPCYVKKKDSLTRQDVYRLMHLCIAYECAVCEGMSEALHNSDNDECAKWYRLACESADKRDTLTAALRSALGITTATGWDTGEH